ncbi:hypothetical protein AAFF_G00159650 [Aldrovandia affinis]|uniref:BZIP domain-containing protein n=1 Tax=Aldrovandia affinis TaxID=143900 RepID=A0AAD7RNB4_9TELE|nr:hypothetical protein AAFF_G00159650 [Aldrovandia affinis]
MASDLMLDFENHLNQHHFGMNSDGGDICIDQGGEWDSSLFDELEDMVDADELLRAMEDITNVGEVSDLDLDMGLPLWNSDTCGDTSSSCTDADMTVDSLSPNPTLSSVSSPGSAEALSPYSLSDEPLPPPSRLSPASCGSSDVPLGRKPHRRSSQASRAKSSQPLKRPIRLTPKVSIQPKPVITAVPIPHAKTILIQPLQALLPVAKPPPVTIQPAPPTGYPVMLSQPAHVVQLRSPQMVPSPPILSLPDRVVTMPTLSQDRRRPAVTMTFPAITQPVGGVTLHNAAADGDTNVERRQQRMIKNRESASLSRKKKKEYLLTLEARLKVALSENEKLMSENGSLKKQLEGLMTENNVLKGTAPRRRTVCLLVVLVLLMLNVGPMSLLDGNSSSKTSAGTMHSGRHLLGFSPNTENLIGPETHETAISLSP